MSGGPAIQPMRRPDQMAWQRADTDAALSRIEERRRERLPVRHGQPPVRFVAEHGRPDRLGQRVDTTCRVWRQHRAGGIVRGVDDDEARLRREQAFERVHVVAIAGIRADVPQRHVGQWRVGRARAAVRQLGAIVIAGSSRTLNSRKLARSPVVMRIWSASPAYTWPRGGDEALSAARFSLSQWRRQRFSRAPPAPRQAPSAADRPSTAAGFRSAMSRGRASRDASSSARAEGLDLHGDNLPGRWASGEVSCNMKHMKRGAHEEQHARYRSTSAQRGARPIGSRTIIVVRVTAR